MSSSAGKDSPAEVKPRPGAHTAPEAETRDHVDADDLDPDVEDLDLTFRDDNILIDAHEDRWHWRRKIRRDPRKLIVYRIAVGIAGVFFVVLGFLTGPIPGPGGIPLVLLGLAILASEFEWAHRLMQYFKAQLHRFRQWTRPKQVLFWMAFVTCCGLFGYTYMLLLGIPGWVPAFVDSHLTRLPGL